MFYSFQRKNIYFDGTTPLNIETLSGTASQHFYNFLLLTMCAEISITNYLQNIVSLQSLRMTGFPYRDREIK